MSEQEVPDFLKAIAGEVAKEQGGENPPTPEPPQSPSTRDVVVEVPQTPATPAPEPFDSKKYVRSLSEKVGLGEIEDEDRFVQEFTSIREKAKKADEDPFANEVLKRANDYVKQGGDIGFFLQSQTVDFNKLKESNPDELLFLHRKITEGNLLTDEEIRADLDYKYNVLVDEFADESEKRQAMLKGIDKKRALQEAERYLKDWQVQNAVPPAEAERQKREKQVEEQNRLYIQRLEESIGKGEITVGGKTIQMEWKDDKGNLHPTTKAVKEAMEDPHGFIMKTFATDGVFDAAKIRNAAYILSNLDNIASILSNEARGAGVAEVVQQIENPSQPGQDARPQGAKSAEQRALEEAAKIMFGR